ncbi:MAG: carboxypeptidase-like regulatory domain-containing protein, partial [Cystobacter sp.]
LTVDKPAQPNDLGDLVLKRAARVTGRVREEGGAPVADAVVGCDACDDSVMTGPDGTFTLSSPSFVKKFNISARKGRLSASAPVSGEAERPLELVLKRATRLSGAVYRDDGTPAAGIQVEGVNTDRSEPLSFVTGPDGRYAVDAAPGSYRFMLGGVRMNSGQSALIVQVGEGEQRLDFGPAPGTVPLTVRLQPERGRMLWVVAGDARGELLSRKDLSGVRYGQVIFQPDADQVSLKGFAPGRYTIAWASLHNSEAPLTTRLVDLPSSAEVVLSP